MSEKRFTIVFEGDISKIDFNPMTAHDTKFGNVVGSSVGDALARADELEAELNRAHEDKAIIWLDAKAALARVAELKSALEEIAALQAPLSTLGDQIFAVTRARSALRAALSARSLEVG